MQICTFYKQLDFSFSSSTQKLGGEESGRSQTHSGGGDLAAVYAVGSTI